MKKLLLITALLFSGITVFSQIPPGYYDTAEGLGGDGLKTALYNIIKGHREYIYTEDTTDVWDILKETDKDPNNAANVILLYTGWSTDAAQEWNSGDGWEREHVWAKSHGNLGTEPGAGTDVHHLRPAHSSLNSARSNRWFAECDEEYIHDGTPTGTYTSSTDHVWKPRDEVKGDVARMIFYMATRYEGENGEPDLQVVDYFLVWHIEDPVSDWERNRNNIIYSYQNNRNPFIDHPEWAECIWSNNCSGSWFTSFPEIELTDRDTYSYSISASGSGIEDLTISEVEIPDWLTFSSVTSESGSATATLIGSPQFSDIGTHDVSIKLSNGTNETFQNYIITVTDGNPIAFTSTPIVQAQADSEYQYNIEVSGDDGAVFTLTGTNLPSWLNITNNTGASGTLSGTPSVGDVGTHDVTLNVTDDETTRKTVTQVFQIRVTDPNAPQVIISQYYEGNSNDKYIEITNVGNVTVNLSNYHLGRWSTTDSPSGNYANGGALSGTINSGESLVYKNPTASAPTYASSAAAGTTEATFYNGDDPVALTKGGLDWEDRVDCIYSAIISSNYKWGAETSFYRNADVTQGNIAISVLDGMGEWTEVSITEVNNAGAESSEYLGNHIFTSTKVEAVNSNVKLFPNPAKNILVVETQNEVNFIEIIDMAGKVLLNQNVSGKKNSVSVSDLKSGIYFIKITESKGKVSFSKFVK